MIQKFILHALTLKRCPISLNLKKKKFFDPTRMLNSNFDWDLAEQKPTRAMLLIICTKIAEIYFNNLDRGW